MKYVFIIAVLLIAGCSAEAYETHEAKVLSSLTDDYSQSNPFQQNPEFMLSKCYELSGENRVLCFNTYVQTMHEQERNREIPEDICDKIGMDVCDKAVWQ